MDYTNSVTYQGAAPRAAQAHPGATASGNVKSRGMTTASAAGHPTGCQKRILLHLEAGRSINCRATHFRPDTCGSYRSMLGAGPATARAGIRWLRWLVLRERSVSASTISSPPKQDGPPAGDLVFGRHRIGILASVLSGGMTASPVQGPRTDVSEAGELIDEVEVECSLAACDMAEDVHVRQMPPLSANNSPGCPDERACQLRRKPLAASHGG